MRFRRTHLMVRSIGYKSGNLKSLSAQMCSSCCYLQSRFGMDPGVWSVSTLGADRL